MEKLEDGGVSIQWQFGILAAACATILILRIRQRHRYSDEESRLVKINETVENVVLVMCVIFCILLMFQNAA